MKCKCWECAVTKRHFKRILDMQWVTVRSLRFYSVEPFMLFAFSVQTMKRTTLSNWIVRSAIEIVVLKIMHVCNKEKKSQKRTLILLFEVIRYVFCYFGHVLRCPFVLFCVSQNIGQCIGKLKCFIGHSAFFATIIKCV